MARKDFPADDVRSAVEWCKGEGYLDDALFARLYVEGRTKAVGDVRLVGELVRRGVDRDIAAAIVARCESTEEERLARALDVLFRGTPLPTYAGAARRLERLGFPAASIYRHLRVHASRFAVPASDAEETAGAPE